MTSRTGSTYAPWTQDELDILARGVAAGLPSDAIAPDLPKRSLEAIKTRRRQLEQYPSVRQPTNVVRPKAAASVRIEVLRKTIDRELAVGRPDWDYVDELIGGLQMLQAGRA